MKLSSIFNMHNLKNVLGLLSTASAVASPFLGVFSPPAQALLNKIIVTMHAAEVAIPPGPTSGAEKMGAVMEEITAGLNFDYSLHNKTMSPERRQQAVAAISGLKDAMNFFQGVSDDLHEPPPSVQELLDMASQKTVAGAVNAGLVAGGGLVAGATQGGSKSYAGIV